MWSYLFLLNRNSGEILFAAGEVFIKTRRDVSPGDHSHSAVEGQSHAKEEESRDVSPNFGGGRNKNTVSPHCEGESQSTLPWWFSSVLCSQCPAHQPKMLYFYELVKNIFNYMYYTSNFLINIIIQGSLLIQLKKNCVFFTYASFYTYVF